jgi:hypothetical protein
MVSRVLIRREDDLDGSEATETIQFGIDNVEYEIDLSADNAAKLRESVASYVDKARKVGGRTRKASATVTPLVDTKAVRAWAQANGIELAKRGRIPTDVISQYQAAGN